MANYSSNGAWQNHARIEWEASVGNAVAGTTHVNVTVRAYLRMEANWSIVGTWTKSWSGAWGSGSSSHTYNLHGGQRVLIVQSSRSVALTSSVRTLTHSVTAQHFHGSTSSTWSGVRVPAKVPAPGRPTLTLDSATTSSFRASWTTPGSSITNWQVQVATNSSFSGATTFTGKPPRTITGRQPGTTYYARARNYNGSGWSAWSATKSITTVPAVAPSLSLAGNAAGTQITATMSASGSPSSYWLEWEYLGPGGVPAGQNGSQSGGNVQTISGRVPGATYRVRAWTRTGTYDSPKTGWQTITLNQPTVVPGDYFDGSTAARGEEVYSWAGTAHASASIARAPAVKGWKAYDSGVTLYRAAGALLPDSPSASDAHRARAFCHTEPVVPFIVGVAITDLFENAPYSGSIYVRTNRDMRLRALLYWDTTIDGASVGEEVEARAGEIVRLSVSGTSPSVITVGELAVLTGEGEELLPGDTFDFDHAIVELGSGGPYFDGSYPDAEGLAYAWEGTAHDSISTETPNPRDVVDPFEDPDCAMPPSPPRAPVIDNPCIEEVGSWRRYWAAIPASEISTWLDVLPTFTITSGGLDAGQVRVRIFENPDELPAAEFYGGDDFIAEQTISFVPKNSEVVLDSLTERAYGRSGDGEWQDVNHLLYGSGGRPASWPVLSCGISYMVAFDVPLEAPLGNVSIDAALTLREG